MKNILIYILLFFSQYISAQTITVESELKRMILVKDKMQEQNFRTVMASSFDRSGGNEDWNGYLSIENNWYVIADWKGPGVVTRILSARANETISRADSICIIIDGNLIIKGRIWDDFFSGTCIPFTAPICVQRDTLPDYIEYGFSSGCCYVPITFSKSFKLLQSQQVNIQVNAKLFNDSVKVKSFTTPLSSDAEKAWQTVANVWHQLSIMPDTSSNIISKTEFIDLQPGGVDTITTIQGPAIIRAIKWKHNFHWDYHSTPDFILNVFWDEEDIPSLSIPLKGGFGSYNQRTLLLGNDIFDWQYMYFPMPFNKSAQFVVEGQSNQGAQFYVMIEYEHSEQQEDLFYFNSSYKRINNYPSRLSDIPIEDYFYNCNYCLVDLKGKGHYVGTTMDIFGSSTLDEMIFVDGYTKFPDNTWNGTSRMEYFDSSWGNKPVSELYTSGGIPGKEVFVRLHWNDPIVFNDSLRVTFELPEDQTGKSHYESVSYWYQASNTEKVFSNSPPQVEIIMPHYGGSLFKSSQIFIDVHAFDYDGRIAKVEFFNGKNKIGEKNSYPYVFKWKDVGIGDYTVSVVATDNLGSKTTSKEIVFHVRPPLRSPNLALKKSVRASSQELNLNELNPDFVTDGNQMTRWSSNYDDPQWIEIDLGKFESINRILLKWEAAYGKAFQIQVSKNGQEWMNVYSTDCGDGDIDDIVFATIETRFVRMLGTVRGTPWGYSLWEFEIYHDMSE